MLPHFDSDRIAQFVTPGDVVEAIRRAFDERLSPPISHIDRIHREVGGGDFLIMGATLEAGTGPEERFAVAGTKLIMVQPNNAGTSRPLVAGSYSMFDATRGVPVATFDGAALTNLRTPAVSVVAAQTLAVPEPKSLVIVGNGVQGKAHLQLFEESFPSLEHTSVVLREGAIPDADLIVFATSSVNPVAGSAEISAGAHVTLVGAFKPGMREVGPDLVRRSRVFVDELAAAKAEAGDLIQAANGGWLWASVEGGLSDICSGRAIRNNFHETTIFKSVGLAVEDLIVARLVAMRAELFG